MKRQTQGFVLIVTLLLLIVTMTLLTGYVIFTMMESRNTRSTADMSSGFYAAEAGLNIEVEEIRTIFEDYRRPNLTEGNCEDQDPVTFSDRVVDATVCAEKLVDDASEATRISDADNPFNGLLSFDSVYNINSVATNSNGDVETQLDMQLRVQEIPVFQFAAFYDGNFEVFPGPDMEITGRVHANGVVGLFKSGGGKLSLMENVTSASICKPPLPEQKRCAEGERTMKMYHRQISNWNRSGAGTSQIKMPDGSFEKFGSGGPSEWTAEELEDTFQGRAQIINELQVPQASSFARQTAANTSADDDEDAFLYWKRADLRLIAHQPDDSNDTDAVVDVFDEAGRTAPSVTYWKGFDAREGQGWWGLDGWWNDTTRDDPGEPETYRTLTECLLSGSEDSEEFDLEEHLFTDTYFDDDGNPVDAGGDTVANDNIEDSTLHTLISDARAPEDCFPLIGSYEPTVEMPKVEVHTESGVDNTATRKLYQAMLDMPGVITVNVPRNHIEAGFGRPDSNDWRSPPNETLNMVVRDSRNINHSGFNMVADRDETSGGHYMWPQAYNPVNNTRDDVEFTYFPLGPDDANRDVYAFDEGDNVAAPLPCSVYDNRPLGRVGSPIGGVGIRAHEEDLVFRGQTRNSQRYAQHFINDLMALPRNTAIMRFRLISNDEINDGDITGNGDPDVIDVLFLDNGDNSPFIPTGSNDTFDYTGGNPNQNSDEGRELEAMREYYAWSYPVTIGMLMDYMYDDNSYEWDIDHDEDDKIGIEHFLANNNDTPKDVDHNISIDVDDLGFFFPFWVDGDVEVDDNDNINVYNPDEDNPDIVENETFQIALLKAIAHDLENNEGNGFDLDDDANQDGFDFDEEDDRLQSRMHLSNTFDPHAAHNLNNDDRRWYDDKDGRDKDFRNFVKALLGVSEDDGDRWMTFDNGGNDEEFDDNLHHHGLVIRPGLLQNLQSSWYTFGYDPEDLEDICAAVPTRGELYSYREERELFVLNINVGELMQTDDSDLIDLSEDNESESGIVLYASFEGEGVDEDRDEDGDDFKGNNYAVRLYNGADFSLGNGANATDNNSVRGFTFVTDQAAMVQGDFNCIRDGDGCRGDDDASGDDRRRIGAAVLADSPNILSVEWMDIYSRGRLKNNRRDSGDRHVHRWYRRADETRQNVALLGGSDEAGYMEKNDDIEGGGLHNYPRFWEDWGGRAYRYKGSLVSFNLPQKWSGRFATQNRNGDNDAAYFGERNRGCCTIVYSPPNRLWEYDKNFESPRNLPPLTPRVVYLNQESFSRDFTQD